MNKFLGIVVLGLLLSACADIYQEAIYQTRYINRALYPNETINLMGRNCVCYDENIAGQNGLRDNLIEFNDDKLGWIKYYFGLEPVQSYNISSHGYYYIYENFDVIKKGRWEMNLRGKILLDGDKNNTMRFHLKQENYKDNNLAVKIKNNNYQKGKFFNINLILKDSFYRDLREIK